MSDKKYTARVGWFVFLGLVLIAALMLNFSRGVGFFKPRYELNMSTRTVAGLKEGADVYLSGVKIGSVKAIRLETQKQGVQVQLTLLEEFPLHTDSKFMMTALSGTSRLRNTTINRMNDSSSTKPTTTGSIRAV